MGAAVLPKLPSQRQKGFLFEGIYDVMREEKPEKRRPEPRAHQQMVG
jgi:hypothetical protein